MQSRARCSRRLYGSASSEIGGEVGPAGGEYQFRLIERWAQHEFVLCLGVLDRASGDVVKRSDSGKDLGAFGAPHQSQSTVR